MDDREAFIAFTEQHSRALLQTAWLLTGDWPNAEDIVQIALVKLWRQWGKLRNADSALSYARRVVATTFLNSRRRRWVGEIPVAELPDRGGCDVPDTIDTRRTVTQALRQLPPKQRAVLVLRYFDDLSERSTAELLGCSIGTVKSQTARALERLRTSPALAALIEDGRTPRP